MEDAIPFGAAEPISLRLFIHGGFKNVTFNDFLPPTMKTIVFGLLIGMISCFQGVHATGGSRAPQPVPWFWPLFSSFWRTCCSFI
jgi:hypothetical protein